MTSANELSRILGLGMYLQLKKVSPDVAIALLRDKGLTPEQHTAALALCKPDAPSVVPVAYVGQQRLIADFTHMRATLWICGVSYHQMALLAGVTANAIRQSILRVLTQEERARYSSGRTGQVMSHGGASAYHAAYTKHASVLIAYHPIEAATQLHDLAKEYVDE